ncbi:MAG: hypothetical protein RRY79_06120 [Clostridia bacterium]
MSSQNIYDNQTFFDGYKKLRENSYSANNLEAEGLPYRWGWICGTL